MDTDTAGYVEYGSGIGCRKTMKNEFEYIHLVTTLETDTNTDINIIGFISDNSDIHYHFPSLPLRAGG